MHTYDANNIYLVNLGNYLQGHDDKPECHSLTLNFKEMIKNDLMISYDFLKTCLR